MIARMERAKKIALVLVGSWWIIVTVFFIVLAIVQGHIQYFAPDGCAGASAVTPNC